MSRLSRSGLVIPRSLCVTADAYRDYVGRTGLDERIDMEINRKSWADLRWEEMWDASLRIRNRFLKTPLPASLHKELYDVLKDNFESRPTAIRSSAPDEDAAQTSFAGLHESYIGVMDADDIIEHIRLVWASLWSDRALLYRRELNLDARSSSMAVLVQEMIPGRVSGVIFTRNPMDNTQAVVEAVYGLNQGLVDGSVEPDRWFLDGADGRILSHQPPENRRTMVFSNSGLGIENLDDERRNIPPLSESDINNVFNLAGKAVAVFNQPQDVEWTIGDQLTALQSRPITAKSDSDRDQKSWYLSLTRSLENLRRLRRTIEDDVLPGMEKAAYELASTDLNGVNIEHLKAEEVRRKEILDYWTGAYWEHCIPFAHGIRLFGQVYNDRIKPQDPFEFMDLLRSGDLLSVQRNKDLYSLAGILRNDSEFAGRAVLVPESEWPEEFRNSFSRFIKKHGDSAWDDQRLNAHRTGVLRLVLGMAENLDQMKFATGTPSELEQVYFGKFDESQRRAATELLDLARASYRLRDDDNIYLGRIRAQWARVKDMVCERPDESNNTEIEATSPPVRITASSDPNYPQGAPDLKGSRVITPLGEISVRQLVGQPAGPGIATGPARVVMDVESLFEFKAGEVLVCDAVEPNMTLVAPLAAGIVERRGGMLIHGAIIAREYGLPCVTGIPGASTYIQTGDQVTVDGYIGLITVSSKS